MVPSNTSVGVHRHRAGFDLREVENVADQVEQVGAGAVNGARELDLFAAQDASPGFSLELLAEIRMQSAGAQLVRHVGQELRLST
jgi:hypothetical protein